MAEKEKLEFSKMCKHCKKKKAIQDGYCEGCFGNWEAWQEREQEESLRTERCR